MGYHRVMLECEPDATTTYLWHIMAVGEPEKLHGTLASLYYRVFPAEIAPWLSLLLH